VRAARRNWLFCTLLTAGVTLRALTQIAYRPALLYIDSYKYLTGAEGSDPVGYRVMLRPLEQLGGLGLVTATQHALALAMAGALYLLLTRRGAPRWAAALATAPVLLDAYQLQLEQTIMPDVMFEALILAGMVILLWNRRPGATFVALGGLVLGATTDVRQFGEVLIIPALFYVLLSTRGWRRQLMNIAVLGVSFAIPILAYMTAFYATSGQFKMTSRGVDVLYGRAAYSANCQTLKIPDYERSLCPSKIEALTLGIDGIINNSQGPLQTYKPPAGMTVQAVKTSFELNVIRQQPLAIGRTVARDSVKLFALTRNTTRGDPQISRWQFQVTYPTYPPAVTLRQATSMTKQFGGGPPVAVKQLAAILRAYQLNGGYTPGPFFALTALAGLLGSLFVFDRRSSAQDRQLACTCLLATFTAASVLLGADFFEFSWRYQLPALVTLPAAGALGFAVLQKKIEMRRYPQTVPLRGEASLIR
jgi:hypothetical protein